jgi:hypothetical protein
MGVRVRVGRLIGFGLLLEAILAASAIVAGFSFVTSPDGSGMQMPVTWLDRTPFSDYFVPGLVLITVNGLLPVVVILLALVGSRFAPIGMMLSGILLFGWLSIQLALIRMVHPVMHPTLYALAVAVILIGYVAWHRAQLQPGTPRDAAAGV